MLRIYAEALDRLRVRLNMYLVIKMSAHSADTVSNVLCAKSRGAVSMKFFQDLMQNLNLLECIVRP